MFNWCSLLDARSTPLTKPSFHLSVVGNRHIRFAEQAHVAAALLSVLKSSAMLIRERALPVQKTRLLNGMTTKRCTPWFCISKPMQNCLIKETHPRPSHRESFNLLSSICQMPIKPKCDCLDSNVFDARQTYAFLQNSWPFSV